MRLCLITFKTALTCPAPPAPPTDAEMREEKPTPDYVCPLDAPWAMGSERKKCCSFEYSKDTGSCGEKHME